MNFNNEILYNLRKAKKCTQKDIAKELSITRGAYAKYERGEAQPDIKSIKILASLFNVSTDYLLGYEKEITKKELPSEEEALKNYFIKKGILPADRDLTDEEFRDLSNSFATFFKHFGDKQ